MWKYLAVAAAAVFIVSCASKSNTVTISGNVFEDAEAPCIQVVFPHAVAYQSTETYSRDGQAVRVYNLHMPQHPYYDVSVVKRRNTSDAMPWLIRPVGEDYPDALKFYEIQAEDSGYGRSGVVAITEKDGDIYIRSVTGEFTSSSTGYFVIIDRLIHRAEYRRSFSLEEWRQSTSGAIFLDDMKKQADWIYRNARSFDCGYRSGPSQIWWEN